MAAKSEASGASASYFRVARPLPSLVTVLVLGYFGVRCRAARRFCFGPPGSRRARGTGKGGGGRSCACAFGGCLGNWRKRKFGGLVRFSLGNVPAFASPRLVRTYSSLSTTRGERGQVDSSRPAKSR